MSNRTLKTKFSNLRGFTLLELVIVIAIIGILAVIVLPSMLSALAKARDAKKMSELRGSQTFLTVTGIDTSLRYPADQTQMLAWYTATNNRPPVGYTGATPVYTYKGLGCGTGYTFKVGTLPVLITDVTCASYQLWTELEQRAVALTLDADLTTAANCTTGSTVNGPCVSVVSLGGVDADVAQAGDQENCSSTGAVPDCVFDLVP